MSADCRICQNDAYYCPICRYEKEIQELKAELKREREESNKLIKAISNIVNYSFLESESSYSEAINALKAYKND